MPPPPETGAQFPVLDTLRAVGALCVLTTHAAFWSGAYTDHGVWGTLLARLDVGVAIFFVLSGFLLGRPWLIAASRGTPAPGVLGYFFKRFLRIAPAYVLTVLIALSLIEANADLGAGDWATTLLMLSTLTGSTFPAGLTQMWSLAVEVTFYLVLPLLMIGLVGRRPMLRTWRILTGLAVMVAITLWWHLDGAGRVGEHSAGATLQWLPAYLSWFALGLLLALVQVRHQAGPSTLARPFVTLARQPGSCWVAAAGLMLVAATPLAGPSMLAAPTPAQSLTKNVLYAGVGFLVVLTGVFADPHGRYGALASRTWGRRLGWISYGIFCLHLPALHLVMWTTGWPLFQGRGFAIWLLALLVSLVAAELVYRLVERPALRLKRLGRPRGHHEAVSSAPTSGTTIT